MKNLLEQMKPEIAALIKDNGDGNYREAMDQLTKNTYFTDVTFSGVVHITSFTHPDRPATLLEFIHLFES